MARKKKTIIAGAIIGATHTAHCVKCVPCTCLDLGSRTATPVKALDSSPRRAA